MVLLTTVIHDTMITPPPIYDLRTCYDTMITPPPNLRSSYLFSMTLLSERAFHYYFFLPPNNHLRTSFPDPPPFRLYMHVLVLLFWLPPFLEVGSEVM